ncbi:MAG: orotate phosphoribosyltransferase [Deltaproteobacteria bacterium]|nr:orotate phosphoribosyltransferase [Deltaproteobacteria bacterium]
MIASVGESLASVALSIGAVRFNPENPFRWASGYYMPIYNDNRLLLSSYAHRQMIKNGFLDIIDKNCLSFDVVAGVATGGISPATTLADALKLPFLYVRQIAKQHGAKKSIEGKLEEGKRVLVIEDVVSTGGSSVQAVENIRESGGRVDECLVIFSYNFSKAIDAFRRANCNLRPLLTLDELLDVARDEQYLSEKEFLALSEWQSDPFMWGEQNGYPPEITK